MAAFLLPEDQKDRGAEREEKSGNGERKKQPITAYLSAKYCDVSVLK
ncbi:hypothetical protein [Bradyrhizobium genosp. P]